MNAYERSGLVPVVALSLASAVLSCKEELADPSLLDAGVRLDAGAGARTSDGGLACSGASAPAAGKCGGLHCNQTLSDVRSGTQPQAACSADEEVAAFCANDSVGKVGTCARNALGAEAATRSCAKMALPTFSADCLDGYVQSAACAGQKCLADCGSGDSPACDACRIGMGCMADFYACSGHKPPSSP